METMRGNYRYTKFIPNRGIALTYLLVSSQTALAAGPAVMDWRPLPTQTELNALTANPINDPFFPFTDYRPVEPATDPVAPAANRDLPGLKILKAMSASADQYGSRGPGQPKHTDEGHQRMLNCLTTGYLHTHWSDLALHYYCQIGEPRRCYTLAVAGTPGSAPLSRKQAYEGCAKGQLPHSKAFAWVAKNQPMVFQYVMYGQTAAFNHEQEQAIINAFYGVTEPSNPSDCNKRPRRAEDPIDGTHCLATKTMSPALAGKGR